jgi:hypothetical protein
MRNALLTLTILFCLAAVSTAADQKKSAQAQPKQTQQTQVARNDTMGPAFAPARFQLDGRAGITKFLHSLPRGRI